MNDKIPSESSATTDARQSAPQTTDAMPDADGGGVRLTIERIEKIIEAVLFASGAPVEYKKFADMFSMTVMQIRTLAEQLRTRYAGRGIELLCYTDSAQFVTNEEFSPYVKDALGIKKGVTLSQSSLEVLAVIAYNQPVTRAYIEQIRGVDSGYAISVLTERSLIESKGRLDAPGKPNLYGTTDEFFKLFGISSLTELPSVDILK